MNLIQKLAYNPITKMIQAILPGGVSIQIADGKSGTYTPVLTGVSNVAALTAYLAHYVQIGNQVLVFGSMDVDPTTGGVSTQVGISLPIASNLTSYLDLSGCFVFANVSNQNAIVGDTTNDRAEVQYTPVSASNLGAQFSFMYTIK